MSHPRRENRVYHCDDESLSIVAELSDRLLCLFLRYALRISARQSFHRHRRKCLRIVSHSEPSDAAFFEFEFSVCVRFFDGNFAYSSANFDKMFVGNHRNANQPSGIAVFFADFVRLLHHANRLPLYLQKSGRLPKNRPLRFVPRVSDPGSYLRAVDDLRFENGFPRSGVLATFAGA